MRRRRREEGGGGGGGRRRRREGGRRSCFKLIRVLLTLVQCDIDGIACLCRKISGNDIFVSSFVKQTTCLLLEIKKWPKQTTLEFFSGSTVLFKHESVVISLFKTQVETRFVVFGMRSIYNNSLYETKELPWPFIFKRLSL